MTKGPGPGIAAQLVLQCFLALALLLGSAVFDAPAMAQERHGLGWSLRELLFPRRSERVRPPAAIEKPRPRKKRVAPRPPPEPEAPVVEKAEDARVVLVVGDFMASGLAEGLEKIFADNPDIAVVNRSNGSSGFVRDDFYDWPAEIDAILDEEKPTVVVVMIGSNDRQSMLVGGARESPRSDAWTKEYEGRADGFAKSLADRKLPFLWVGQPPFKFTGMTSDMLAFNDIYRDAAEAAGGEFADIWDGFADENGAFVSAGPDVNGQPVRLRSDDGINMTEAGRRKLAFYAEKPLLKILGLSTPEGEPAAGAPAGTLPAINPDGTAVPADRTPPMSLADPALDGGTELLGATPPAGSLPGIEAEQEDTAAEGQPGRADDFSWPPEQPPAAAAASTSPQTTTAIDRQ